MEYVIGAIVVIFLISFFSFFMRRSNDTINNHNPYDYDPRDND